MSKKDKSDYCSLGGFHYFLISGVTKDDKSVKFKCGCGLVRAYKRKAIKRVLTADSRKSRYFKKGDQTK